MQDTTNLPIGNTEERSPFHGLILPPPDLREIIDKTVTFVYRNGPIFEDRIREKESRNQKFSFLNSNDPYNAYYKRKLELSALNPIPQSSKGTATQATADKKCATSELIESPQFEFQFSKEVPSISAYDLDIIKLTAQFTAIRGAKFSTYLIQSAYKPYHLDFLSSNNSLNVFYNDLVEQYSAILSPSAKLYEKFREHNKPYDRKLILSKARLHAKYLKDLNEKAINERRELDLELKAFVEIDWENFKIVENVGFIETDITSVSQSPIPLSMLQTFTLEEKDLLHSAHQTVSNSENSKDPDVKSQPDSEKITDTNKNLEDNLQPHIVEPSSSANPSMKIKQNYKRKLPTQKPIMAQIGSHRTILASEMQDHMRIELFHSKRKEQKQVETDRNATTNLDSSKTSEYIKRFAKARRDIFESSQSDNQKPIEQEEKRKRIATDRSRRSNQDIH